MMKYFYQTRLQSFTHQLYMYGFQRIGEGKCNIHVYYNELFLRDRFDLCKYIPRQAKGNKITKSAFSMSLISHEDDFYKLPNLEEPKHSNLALVSRNDDISLSMNSSAPKLVKYKVVNLH